jgi:hypothetical protein
VLRFARTESHIVPEYGVWFSCGVEGAVTFWSDFEFCARSGERRTLMVKKSPLRGKVVLVADDEPDELETVADELDV